jgi:hypothetical protein
MNARGNYLTWAQRLVPTLIDLATFAGFVFLAPWLGDQIFAQSSANHIFLVPGFFFIIAGILAIRQIPDYSLDENKGPSMLGVCLVFFLLISYSLLYVYGTNIGGGETQNDGVAVILFFVLLLPIIGAFSWPVTRAKAGTGKALIAEAIALISVNYLTLIGAAVWDHFASQPTSKDPVYATGIAFLILYVILYLLFLALFGLPRIYLLRATGDRVGLAIYMIGVAIFLWDKVPPVN